MGVVVRLSPPDENATTPPDSSRRRSRRSPDTQDASVGLEQQRDGMYGTELLAGSNQVGNCRDTTGQAFPLASASASPADAEVVAASHSGVEVRTRAFESIAFCSGKRVYVLPRLPSWRV